MTTTSSPATDMFANLNAAYGVRDTDALTTQSVEARLAMLAEGLTVSRLNAGMFLSNSEGQPRFGIALLPTGAYVFFRSSDFFDSPPFTGSSMQDAAHKALVWARENAPLAAARPAT